MGFPRLGIKLLVLAGAFLFLQENQSNSPELIRVSAFLLFLYTTPLVLLDLWQKEKESSQRILRRTGRSVFLIVSLFLGIISFRIEPALPREPPEIWKQITGKRTPDYEHAIRIRFQVEKAGSWNRLAGTAWIEKKEFRRKVCHRVYFKKWYTSRSHHRYYRWHHRLYCSSRNVSWKAKTILEKNTGSFPLVIYLVGKKVDPGCILDLRLYGRAIPEKTGYSHGPTTRVRAYAKYNLVKTNCPVPGLPLRFQKAVQKIVFQVMKLRGDRAGVAMGMILGKRSFMSRKFKREASFTGIMHLFAASGLHLGILYGLVYWPLSRWKGRYSRTALLLPIPVAFLPVFLLGFPPSLLRAFFFLLFFTIRSLMQRRSTRLDMVANTALAILLFAPENLTGLSTVLSLGAVTGILFFFPVIYRSLAGAEPGFFRKWISAQFALSFSATLLITPVLIGVFHIHPFLSPFVNLLAVPLTGLILPLLYFGTGLALLGESFLSKTVIFPLIRSGLALFLDLVNRGAARGMILRYDRLLSFPVAVAILLSLWLALESWKGWKKRERTSISRTGSVFCIGVWLLLGPPGFFLFSRAPIPDSWRTFTGEPVKAESKKESGTYRENPGRNEKWVFSVDASGTMDKTGTLRDMENMDDKVPAKNPPFTGCFPSGILPGSQYPWNIPISPLQESVNSTGT